MLRRWIMTITIVLSLIFTVRSVFNLLFSLGLIPRFYPSNYMNPVFWDSLVRLYQYLFSIVSNIVWVCSYNNNISRVIQTGKEIDRVKIKSIKIVITENRWRKSFWLKGRRIRRRIRWIFWKLQSKSQAGITHGWTQILWA